MEEPDRAGAPVGTRERKRLALRRRLSDTATAMFLEQGYDAVRVSDVAQACGVSTKTVWNHFPTKESLLLDRGDRLASALADAVGVRDDSLDVLEVVLTCIDSEVDELGQGDGPSYEGGGGGAVESVQAFVRLVGAHPDLSAAAAARSEQLVRLAADALAVQHGTPAHAPANQILAGAMISLWRLHLTAVLQAGDRSLTLGAVREHVRQEVRIGADLVERLVEAAQTQPRTGPR